MAKTLLGERAMAIREFLRKAGREVRLKEICRAFDCNSARISGYLDRLVDRGLVERVEYGVYKYQESERDGCTTIRWWNDSEDDELRKLWFGQRANPNRGTIKEIISKISKTMSRKQRDVSYRLIALGLYDEKPFCSCGNGLRIRYKSVCTKCYTKIQKARRDIDKDFRAWLAAKQAQQGP